VSLVVLALDISFARVYVKFTLLFVSLTFGIWLFGVSLIRVFLRSNGGFFLELLSDLLLLMIILSLFECDDLIDRFLNQFENFILLWLVSFVRD